MRQPVRERRWASNWFCLEPLKGASTASTCCCWELAKECLAAPESLKIRILSRLSEHPLEWNGCFYKKVWNIRQIWAWRPPRAAGCLAGPRLAPTVRFCSDLVSTLSSGIAVFYKKCETFIKFALWGAPERTRFHCKKQGFFSIWALLKLLFFIKKTWKKLGVPHWDSIAATVEVAIGAGSKRGSDFKEKSSFFRALKSLLQWWGRVFLKVLK